MFILNGNQELSVMTKACLTVRQKRQTGTKVGHNEPIDFYERAIDHLIKGTPGITA